MGNEISLYDQLDAETRIVVQQRTGEIKVLMRRTGQDIMEIGQKLIEVKTCLEHGNFGKWLDAEFGWDERTAQRFVNVAEQFQNRQIVGFEPSALYLLSAPSTPEEAREEAVDRAAQGETITHKKAKKIVEKHKPEPPAAPGPAVGTGYTRRFGPGIDREAVRKRLAEDWGDDTESEGEGDGKTLEGAALTESKLMRLDDALLYAVNQKADLLCIRGVTYGYWETEYTSVGMSKLPDWAFVRGAMIKATSTVYRGMELTDVLPEVPEAQEPDDGGSSEPMSEEEAIFHSEMPHEPVEDEPQDDAKGGALDMLMELLEHFDNLMDFFLNEPAMIRAAQEELDLSSEATEAIRLLLEHFDTGL